MLMSEYEAINRDLQASVERAYETIERLRESLRVCNEALSVLIGLHENAGTHWQEACDWLAEQASAQQGLSDQPVPAGMPDALRATSPYPDASMGYD
jgi:alcohol dehydrogenase class IV